MAREDAAGVLALDLGLGDVVAHAEVLHGLAVLAHDRRDHRVDVVGRAVLGAVLDDAAEHLAAADRRPQLLERLLGHVGMPRGAVRRADQLVAAVLRDLDELVVDVEDVALLVGLRDDAGDVHDVGAHLQLGLDVGQACLASAAELGLGGRAARPRCSSSSACACSSSAPADRRAIQEGEVVVHDSVLRFMRLRWFEGGGMRADGAPVGLGGGGQLAERADVEDQRDVAVAEDRGAGDAAQAAEHAAQWLDDGLVLARAARRP